MEYSYSNRNYLLPKGCKDLIDAIHMPREIKADIVRRKDGIIFKFKVADLRQADAEIVFEGSHLCINEKSSDKAGRQKFPYDPIGFDLKRKGPRRDDSGQRVLSVPAGYDLTKALTTYTEDEVRIFVPRC